MQNSANNTPISTKTILHNIEVIAEGFKAERSERQRRRQLERPDFDLLTEAGYPLLAVPVEMGGTWENIQKSTRPIAEIMRTLAHGDPSIALVSSMHPAVISSWLVEPEAPTPYTKVWKEQSEWVYQTAIDGHFWGTIISEPGSGGDQSKTRSMAKRGQSDGQYLISGQKHFGSGSGMTSFMITMAIPEGEDKPDRFFMDMRDVPWDGSKGVKLIAPWDGQGMTATQSHGMSFEDFPATRTAWPNRLAGSGGIGSCLFTAVIVGIIESAMAEAKKSLGPKRASMRPFEQVEWSRVEMDNWLIHQAYEGMLRSVETDDNRNRNTLLGKEAVAQLAETLMLRITKVIGGSAYSRHSPFGFWLEDVRALGFLRPPWGFAFDTIFSSSWED